MALVTLLDDVTQRPEAPEAPDKRESNAWP
jgi:hypothetical protein